MLKKSGLIVVLLGCGACGNSSSPATLPKGPSTLPVASSSSSSSSLIATTSNCAEPKTPLSASPNRDKGIEAFLLDRPREALDLLAVAIKNDPRDRVAEAFRLGAAAKMDDAKERATDDTAHVTRLSLASHSAQPSRS